VARPRLGWGGGAAFGLAALLIAILPSLVGQFRVVQLTVFLIYGMLALSLDLVWGLAGILSFGQAALFGIGGYTYGIVAINTGLPLLGLAAGIAMPAGVAAVLGYVSFYGRVAPMFFAVITLIVALILYQVMGSTADPRYAIGAARLGGYNGMTMIPTPGGELPFMSGAPLSPSGLLYFVGGLLLVALAMSITLARSSFGRILQGIRENEQRAELLGFDIRWRKTAIFTVAGARSLAWPAGCSRPGAISSTPKSSACHRPRSWSSGCWSGAEARCTAQCSAPSRSSFCPAILVPRVRPTRRFCSASRFWRSCYSSRRGWRRRFGGRSSAEC
jgi:branched-subunit amino acid ABC-type transport system permease component